MEKVLVDSCIFIDIFRGNQNLYRDLLGHDVSINSIVYMELIQGARDKQELNMIDKFLRRFEIFSINEEISPYFYKTKDGAHVGDVFMSLIETCRRAKANPIEYLTMIQENAINVLNNPGKWLPWNYKRTIEEMKSG